MSAPTAAAVPSDAATAKKPTVSSAIVSQKCIIVSQKIHFESEVFSSIPRFMSGNADILISLHIPGIIFAGVSLHVKCLQYRRHTFQN